MIRLVIKGNSFVATGAACARGIPFALVFGNEKETVGDVPAAFFPDIAKWFQEKPGRAPFPLGTLLWFNCGKDAQ